MRVSWSNIDPESPRDPWVKVLCSDPEYKITEEGEIFKKGKKLKFSIRHNRLCIRYADRWLYVKEILAHKFANVNVAQTQ